MVAKKYLSTAEAAELLRTSPGVLANLRHDGRGPRYVKFVRRILYDIDDIENWVQRHKVATIDSVIERR